MKVAAEPMVDATSAAAPAPKHDEYVMGIYAPPDSFLATMTLDTVDSVLQRPRDRLCWLHEFYSAQVLRIIRRVVARQIPYVDAEDVYQEALMDCLWLMEEKPLSAKECLSFLSRIAQRRGLDAVRRRHRGRTVFRDFVCYVDPRSPRPNLSSAHDASLMPAEVHELTELVAGLIAEMPRQQQRVAVLYFDCRGPMGDYGIHERLAQRLSELSARPENPDTIRSLWRCARQRLAAGLRKRGYDWRTS